MKKITKKIEKKTITASKVAIELPPATSSTPCRDVCKRPKIHPLVLDLGREDFNLLVAKVNEIIQCQNS